MVCFSPIDQFLSAAKCKSAVRYAMIILNRPINADKELIEGLWRHGEFHGHLIIFATAMVFLRSHDSGDCWRGY